MRITRRNLNQLRFENHNAKLLIEDIVINSSITLHYYDIEITEKYAIKLWVSIMDRNSKNRYMRLENAS